MIRLGALPPEEAIAFFRQKGYAIGFDHRDVWRQENQAGFTVAKAMQMDLLREIRAHVDDAIAHGTTLESFITNLRPELMRRGWWGKKLQDDPLTGETKEVQLGSTRRLKTIYDANLRTAHSEGQWARIQDAKAMLPYLMYDHTPSAHERKEHAAWDGLVLPADDPWVIAHFPVKAWGCKCKMIQVGQRQLDRLGKSVGTAPTETYFNYVNTRTGETARVPAGVDPAFNYPMGGRRANLVEFLAGRLERLQPDLRAAAARSLTGDALASWMESPAGSFPVAFVAGDAVRVSSESLDQMRRDRPDLSAGDFRAVQDTIERGTATVESDSITRYELAVDGYVIITTVERVGKTLLLKGFQRIRNR